MSTPRADGRKPDQLRPIAFEANIAPYATGSVLVSFGLTRVICAATIDSTTPAGRQSRFDGPPCGRALAQIHVDILDLGVLLERVHAVLAAGP